MKNTSIVVKFSTHRGIFFSEECLQICCRTGNFPCPNQFMCFTPRLEKSSPSEYSSNPLASNKVCVMYGVVNIVLALFIGFQIFIIHLALTKQEKSGLANLLRQIEMNYGIRFIHLHEWWCLWDVWNMCEKRYFHGRIHREYFQITWAAFT